METKQQIELNLPMHKSDSQPLAKSRLATLKQTADSLHGNDSVTVEAEARVLGKISRSRAEIDADVKAKISLPLGMLKGLILFIPNLLKKKQDGV